MWKARKAVVSNCSKLQVRGTVIARNIRLLKEQLPSKTLIVSKTNKRKKKKSLHEHKFHLILIIIKYLHFPLCLFLFSPYLSRLYAPTHYEHWNLLPFHSHQIFHIHRLENVQHRHYSSRLICCVLQVDSVFFLWQLRE